MEHNAPRLCERGRSEDSPTLFWARESLGDVRPQQNSGSAILYRPLTSASPNQLLVLQTKTKCTRHAREENCLSTFHIYHLLVGAVFCHSGNFSEGYPVSLCPIFPLRSWKNKRSERFTWQKCNKFLDLRFGESVMLYSESD